MCSLKLLLFCGAFILGFIVSETEGAQEAHCLLRGTEPYYWIRGEITFRQKNSDGVVARVAGTINNLPQGGVHGLHIHEFGNLEDEERSLSTGSHYNAPDNANSVHSCDISSTDRHTGDLGNIRDVKVTLDGTVANYDEEIENLDTRGPYSIVGRALVLHSKEDDCNNPSDEGTRIAHCVIGISQGENDIDALPPPQHHAACLFKPVNGSVYSYGSIYSEVIIENATMNIIFSKLKNSLLPSSSKYDIYLLNHGELPEWENLDEPSEHMLEWAPDQVILNVPYMNLIGHTLLLKNDNSDTIAACVAGIIPKSAIPSTVTTTSTSSTTTTTTSSTSTSTTAIGTSTSAASSSSESTSTSATESTSTTITSSTSTGTMYTNESTAATTTGTTGIIEEASEELPSDDGFSTSAMIFGIIMSAVILFVIICLFVRRRNTNDSSFQRVSYF